MLVPCSKSENYFSVPLRRTLFGCARHPRSLSSSHRWSGSPLIALLPEKHVPDIDFVCAAATRHPAHQKQHAQPDKAITIQERRARHAPMPCVSD